MEWIREPNEEERAAGKLPERPVYVAPPTARRTSREGQVVRSEYARHAAPSAGVRPEHRARSAGPRRRRRHRRKRFVAVPVLAALLGILAAVLCFARLDADGLPNSFRLYALTHGYTAADWPEKLLELYERNPETKDFVMHYPAEHDRPHEIALTPDGGVPLYLQWDERWGYESYNGDLLALTGCGPCCLSMAATYLTGSGEYDPLTVSRWAEEQGYAVPGAGSTWTLFSEGAEKLGLDAVEIGADEQRVRDNLDVGNVIACVMGPGDFTTEGHFILLTDYDDGYVTVRDPNSAERSAKAWRFADICDQMLALWVLRR